MDLSELGFTKEELQQRVVEHIASQVMEGTFTDEDGKNFKADSVFARTLDTHIKKKIEDTISALAKKHVLPNVAAYIEKLTLQTTNQWGEARGQSVSFIEYLTQRAEVYMQEKVNYEGKSKEQAVGYSWSGTQTRVAHLIHQHLHYSIDAAVKDALKVANSHIVRGIEETVKLKLGEISAALRVELKSK